MKILEKYNYDEKLFEDLRKKYISGQFSDKKNIIKGGIKTPDEKKFFNLKKQEKDEISRLAKLGMDTIKNKVLGVVIVNGGMATRFGGVVKGIVEVFDGKSFLQVKIEQVKKINQKYNVSVPIYLMNSFATEKTTIAYLEENNYFGLKNSMGCFNQFIAKRLNADGTYVSDEKEVFYGPGHGDFIYAFKKSGLLDKFIKNGGKHFWYSNVDNMGATIDEEIMGYHIDKKAEMMVELAQKYTGDKGGAPAIVDGKLQIVEQFKFPPDFNQDLISVFNTATYIFEASALKKEIELPFYYVEKKVGDKKVVQFERLTGDLSIFLKTKYIVVDREKRFIPIKTPDDLEKNRDMLRMLA